VGESYKSGCKPFLAGKKMSQPRETTRNRTAAVARVASVTLFLAALFLVYSNHFDNAFHFDDSHTIVNNSYITSMKNLPLFFTDARTFSTLPTNQEYRPVVTTLNAIDYRIAGELDARVFHWHIFLEFLVLLWLMYHVFLSVFAMADGQQHRLTSFLAMAFFALHTTTAETINYVIQARSDGFSTLMVLAGFVLYARNTGWKKQLGLIPLAIGCLTKPTALMLAPLLALYSLLLERPSLTVVSEHVSFRAVLQRAVKNTWLYFLLGAVLFLFTRWMTSDTWTPGGQSVLSYLNTQPWVIWIYVKTFFLPAGLTADADLELIPHLLAGKVLWGLFVVLGMLALAAVASRSRAHLPIAFGILWFFIALIPTSSIVPLAEVMNHHRTFFPYIGLVMAAAWAGFVFYKRLICRALPIAKFAATAFLITVFSLHGWGTHQRNEVWDSGLSLWHDVSIKSPRNGRGLMNYGLALMEVGRLEEAIDYYEKALATSYGRHPYLYINLGIANNALGQRKASEPLQQKAEEYFKTALSLGPGYPQTYFRYAQWLHKHGRSGEALPLVTKALELAPGEQGARALFEELSLDTASRLQTQRRQAEKAGTVAALIDLSLAYYQAEDFDGTIEAARSALAINPAYAPAYNNICSAHNMMEQYAQAIDACERALALDPEFDLARNNLTWARSKLIEVDD